MLLRRSRFPTIPRVPLYLPFETRAVDATALDDVVYDTQFVLIVTRAMHNPSYSKST